MMSLITPFQNEQIVKDNRNDKKVRQKNLFIGVTGTTFWLLK